jgi:hypothetical protein
MTQRCAQQHANELALRLRSRLAKNPLEVRTGGVHRDAKRNRSAFDAVSRREQHRENSFGGCERVHSAHDCFSRLGNVFWIRVKDPDNRRTDPETCPKRALGSVWFIAILTADPDGTARWPRT